MTVKSREGEGSEFSFSIPYLAGDDAEVLEPVELKDEEKDPATGRILLCEDNELNQRLIEAILTEKKYTVDVAGDGLTGIDLFRKNSYDLVLMDLQMPRQDGRETTRRIRRELKSEVPVIALTANFMNSERVKCLQDGMNDYLSKPFKKSDLFEMINKWINRYLQSNIPTTSLEENKTMICLENLEQMSAGNMEFQQEMINLFLENSKESLEQMKNHLRERKIEQIPSVAHKIKGSFGVIGADLTLLHKLEDAKEIEEAKQHLLALEEQLLQIFTILKNQTITPQT
jgi:CheY-like chemotaxis protein